MSLNKFQDLLKNVPEETKKFVQKQGEIAAQIASILQRKGIKQKVFAKEIGMKESQLSKILAGNANLTIKTIARIESALSTDIIEVSSFRQNQMLNTKVIVLNMSQYSKGKYRLNDLVKWQTNTSLTKEIEVMDLDSNQPGMA